MAAIFLLVPFTFSFDLGDFPQSLIKANKFNVVGVLGQKAAKEDVQAIIDLFEKLSRDYNIPPTQPNCPEGYVCARPVVTPFRLKLDTEITNLSQNIISIGGPCANKITAQIMDLPTSWPECVKGFENGTGRIILYNNWNKTQLVVAGHGAEDTKKAVELLMNYYNKSYLHGYEIKTISTKFPDFERIITVKDTSCSKDRDCRLVFTGCPICEPCCGQIDIINPSVISVNKDAYKCPPKPTGYACLGCICTINFDTENDVVCVENKCEKIGGCPPEYITKINCLPSPGPPNKFCHVKVREWVQKNCHVEYLD